MWWSVPRGKIVAIGEMAKNRAHHVDGTPYGPLSKRDAGLGFTRD